MPALSFYADSIKGVRERNEDSYSADAVRAYHLFVVADGLGGHPAGDIASATTVSVFLQRANGPIQDGKEFLLDCLAEAQITLLRMGQERPEWQHMGTTVLAALVYPDGTGLMMNVGDSRGHVINGGIIHTHDQNMAQEMVQSGELTEEEAMNHPLSTVLSQALGEPEPPVPEFYAFDLKGKYLLLSSDGLHGFVPKETIREIVLSHGHALEDGIKALMEEALRRGSDDNITIILVKGEE
jgi:serine/threonine protein phosphatase PrpC